MIKQIIGFENKMLGTNSLVTTTVLNTESVEIEDEIASYTKYFTT